MKRNIKIIIATLICFLLIGSISLSVYLMSVKKYKDKVANMTVSSFNLSVIPDDTYIGECDVDFIYAKVSVTVSAGSITNIQLLEHKNGKGKPAEGIIDAIIQHQSLDVDAISGATNSSKVIKKAIENALSGH